MLERRVSFARKLYVSSDGYWLNLPLQILVDLIFISYFSVYDKLLRSGVLCGK
jgi:hypothetical protein